MKTLKILLLLLTLIPFGNLFSQYFIDHDKVEQVWQQNLKGYWAKPEEVKDKNIYLQNIRKGRYISDIKIGFDKLEYKSDDLIMVTLKRGYENETDSEMVSISGCAEVFSDQIEIQKYEPAPYYLYLKKGQEIEITLNCKGRKFVRLGFLLGPHLGPHSGESRSYIIRYSDRLTAEIPKDSVSNNKLIINNFMIGPTESKTVPPDTGEKVHSPSAYYYSSNVDNIDIPIFDNNSYNNPKTEDNSYIVNNTSTLSFSAAQLLVNFNGTILYEHPHTLNDTPVNNWRLSVWESDSYDALLNWDPSIIENTYPINSSGGNGSYDINVDITHNYFRAGIWLRRFSGAHEVYYTGRWEVRGIDTVIVAYSLVTDVIPNVYSEIPINHTYVASSDSILETLRRCAHIGNRIDYSISTNVGGDDLSTIQGLVIGTRNDDNVMPDGSFSAFWDPANNMNYIQIGPNADVDLYDAVIIHEHGHTLMFTLTNFEWRAGGAHYADQKNRPGMAFSEGWADYWACIVTNNSSLYSQTPYFYQLDISTVTRNYIYSITSSHAGTYLPNGITIYDGVECEATVAGALWKLTSSNSLSSVWNGLKSQISDGTQNRHVRNMMGYFAANTSLKNSFYSNPSGAEDMGFGRNLSFLTNTTNLQITIPGLSDKTLIYLQGGTYIVNSQIQVDAKSFGIFGMSPKSTILKGEANQNTILVVDRNSDNNWFKISDIQFQNGGFAVDGGATGTDQPRLYMSRCISIANLRGVCFAGDAIIVNNFILDNQDFGIFLISAGAPRTLYIYNNVIHNSGSGLRFNNSVNVSGYIANNMFSDNDNGIATVDPSALSNSRSGINFQFNGTYPYPITTEAGLTVSNNYTDNPVYAVDKFWVNVNYYEDDGIFLGENASDGIFEDLSTGNFYGTKRNWVGAYGGKQAHWISGNLLPTSPVLITTPPLSISGQNVWAGQVNINSTTYILPGASVTIIPGTNILLSDGVYLVALGELNAEGTLTNKITFTRSGMYDTWGSVMFDGSSAANSTLDNVIIEFGTGIRCLNSANVTIQNSLIDHCTQGIYIYNSQPQIINNQITEPTQNGIYGEATGKQPLIQGNVIIKTASNPQYKQFQGIIFGNSTRPFITNNDISGFYHAIYLGGGTYTYLTNDSYVTSNPNNRLKDSRYGLNTGWGSTTTAGNKFTLGGKNSIYNNSSRDVQSYQSSTVYAKDNYWGGGPANKYVDGSSFLSVVPYLSYDPWGGSSAPISNKQEVKDLDNSVPGSGSDLVSGPGSNIPDLLAGIILERDGRISEAVLHYKQMVNRNVFVRPALTSLVSIANEYDRSDLLNYFKEMLNNRTEFKASLLKLLAAMHLHRGNYNKTLKLYDEIIMEYGDGYEGVSARLDKFFAVINYGKNITGAANLLLEIESLNITDEELLIRKEFANYLLNDKAKLNKGAASVNNSTNDNGLPKEFALFDNYPNPFNPTTTIAYAIPKASFVVIKIYDIIDKEVASLVNEQKPGGNYTVKFDASNLSSGIYFYRITSGNFMATKKLILLK